MTLTDLSTIFPSVTTVSSGGTFCWMSPELLEPSRFGSDGRPTRESDCYALGMVIYEVSGLQPLRWSFLTRPRFSPASAHSTDYTALLLFLLY